MFGVRGMGLGAALTFGAVLWWAARGTEPVAEGSARLRELSASHARDFSANAWPAPADRDESAVAPLPDHAGAEPSNPAADAGFESYVFGKFRYLLETSAGAPRGSEALRAALLERERLVAAINTARQGNDEWALALLPARLEQLATQDQRLRQLLPAADLAAFDMLKDSHIEQFQLDDFAAGIRNVAPLQESERRAILFSKLAYRARFREALDQSGLMRGDLSGAQRLAALPEVARALRDSHAGFLQEARQHLSDEERFTLLSNYETSELTAELEKLQRIAAGG